MRRFFLAESFDERPMPDLDSEAIDFRAASESFAEYRKLATRDLQFLRLCTAYQGRSVPTMDGILLFGRGRSDHFSDAWVQAGQFAGLDKAKFVDQAQFFGSFELRMSYAVGGLNPWKSRPRIVRRGAVSAHCAE